MIIDTGFPTFGLHGSLIIPIGAKSVESIEKFVGTIEHVFGDVDAVSVRFQPLEQPNDLPVWKQQRSTLLAHSTQLWVDVNFRNYRDLYYSVFNDLASPDTYVIDHIMNRKLASSLGYKYVRLLHISRRANSSSGRGGETLANGYIPITLSINPDANSSQIVYADPMDLLKMMDINVGGFGLDEVSNNHHLFYK